MDPSSPHTAVTRHARRGRGLACALLGCLGVAAAVGLAVLGSLAFLFFQGRSVVSLPVDAFFTAMDAGDYDAVYGMLSDDWRSQRTPEETSDYLRHIRANLGRCERRRIVSAKINHDQAGTTADVVVRAAFEQGDGAVQLQLVMEDGAWRIEALHYDAAALRETLQGGGLS